VSRSQEAQSANERLANKAEQFRFVSRIPMWCECDDPDCRTMVLISVDEYRDARAAMSLVTAPEHVVDNADLHLRDTEYWVQRRRISNGGERGVA
jgi:hypothetical protein